MGEVYRARDNKLNRSVAIKVLRPAVADDPDRLARFSREAQVLASLNHPHIAHVYGLEGQVGQAGRDGEPACIVMEFVEGPTLADRIAQGPLPVTDALPIARQIAEALEAAHEQGVVHRDLKPANIKVRTDGTVKVLDFGLAKAMDLPAGGANASMSPTITTPAMMTGIGTILGTAVYMSPEQARGKVVDQRADIWAFGCVLFEMLSGRRAFDAEDVSLTLAEVMKSEPDWALLPEIPPAIGVFLRQCFRKDPRQRLQAIGDMRLALDGAFEIATPQTAARVARPPSRPFWKVVIPVAALVVAGGLAGWSVNRPVAPSAQRLSIVLPADQSLAFGCSTCSSLAISPDGRQVAYVSTRPDAPVGGNINGPLHLRSIGAVAVRDLPGTMGAHQPFFSPDGQWVAFFTNADELKKVALAGGNPVTVVANIKSGRYSFGAWTDDHTIIFEGTGGLQSVSDQGGPAEPISTLDAAHGETRHIVTDIIPGTRVALITVAFAQPHPPRIEAIALDTKQRHVVLENARSGRYVASGHLLFQRETGLMVAPFDARALTLSGPAVPMVDEVRSDGPAADGNIPQLAVSREGTLAYVPAVDPNRVLGVVSRAGTFEPLGVPPDRIGRVAVSPDGQKIAFDVATGATTDVRVYDLARGTTTKLTQEGSEFQPAWHPNGRALAVMSFKPDGTRNLLVKELGGGERPLLKEPGPIRNSTLSWSPDGTLAYSVNTPRGAVADDIWVTTTGDKPAAHPWLSTPPGEFSPAFSPDGRWLAYVSDESGQNEVYVKKYPQGDRFPVSASGGGGPAWTGDGKELFFQTSVDGAPKLMVASVSASADALQIGKPVAVLDFRVAAPNGTREQYSSSSIVGRRWDVFPDGRRFLMTRGPDPQGAREIVLVQHWGEELKRVAPLH